MLLARRQPHRLIAQADHGGLVGDLLAVEPCAATLDQAPGFTLRGRKTERDQRVDATDLAAGDRMARSEGHTSELQSLIRISYAVFCLNKQNNIYTTSTSHFHIRIPYIQ